MSSILTEIGRIPSHAKLVQLGDLIETIIDHRGKTPRKLGGDWENEGVPAISAKNVHGGILTNVDTLRYVSEDIYKIWMKEDVQKNDVLIASEGATLGEYLLWDEDFPIVLSQRLFCVRADNEVLYGRYLYAFIRTEAFQKQLFGRATGTSVLGVRQSELLKILIPVIPFEEQVVIGDLIYDFEKKLKLNRQMNQTLEDMAQALFKSWFVEFDPVIDNALLAGNEIPEALKTKAEKRKKIQEKQGLKADNRFPNSFTYNEELGKYIPEGWEVKKLGELSEVISKGTTPRRADVDGKNETINFIKVRDIDDKGSIASDLDLIPEEVHLKQLKRSILRSKDLLFSIAGTIGRVAILPENLNNSNCNQAVAFIRLKDLDNHLILVHQNLKSEFVQQLINSKIVQAVQANASLKNVSEIPITLSSDKLLQVFNEKLSTIYIKLDLTNTQTETLTQLRDTLLPQLISGKLKVPEAMLVVESAIV